MRFWRNTSRRHARRRARPRRSPTGTLGYEWDEDLDNGFAPAGPDRPVDRPRYERPQTSCRTTARPTAPARATHSLTLYRAASGALVFGAGTVQWSWGLDANHDRGGATRRRRACSRRRSTCSPTWACSRRRCSPAWSRRPPRPTRRRPTVDDHLAGRRRDRRRRARRSTITGTATDTGGGVVGGVEVSTDGGATWHPATGRDDLDATPGRPAPPGTATIRSRGRPTTAATSSAPSAGVTVTVGAAHLPVHDLERRGDARRPDEPTRARSSSASSSGPTSPAPSPASASTRAPATPAPTSAPVDRDRHAARHRHLHRRDRHRLAAGDLRQPRCRSPPTPPTSPPTHAPNGHYAEDDSCFASAGRRQPPAARADETASTAPTASTATARHVPDQHLRRRQLLGRRRLQMRSLMRRFRYSLVALIAVAVSATAPAAASAACPCTIWPSTTTPGTAAFPDSSAVNVGVEFRSDQAGYITGVRFYKGAGNTGTHVGNLWTATGTLLSGDVHRRDRDRLATSQLRRSRSDLREHHLRRVLLHARPASTPSIRTSSPRRRRQRRRFTRFRTGSTSATASTSTAARAPSRPTPSAHPTTGSTSSSTPTAADTTPPTVTARTPAPERDRRVRQHAVSATFSEPVQPVTVTMT